MILEISITEECNLNCKYCYVKQKKGVIKDFVVPLENLKSNLHVFSDNQRFQISFFGGEPTLYPEKIKEFVDVFPKIFPDYPVSYTLITNGTNMDDDLWNFIQEKGIGISLSFDGLWQDEIRGKNSTEKILENYRKYFSQRISGCKCMISPESIKIASLKENAEYLLNNGFKYIDFSLVRDDIWSQEDVELYKEQIVELGKWFVEKFKKENFMIGLFWLWIMDSIYGKRDFACFAGHRGLALLPNGKWYPCERFGSVDAYCIIDEEGYCDKELVRIFRYVNNPKHYVGCKGCKIYDFCNGMCMFSMINYIDGLCPILSVCELYRATCSVAHWVYDKLKNERRFLEWIEKK